MVLAIKIRSHHPFLTPRRLTDFILIFRICSIPSACRDSYFLQPPFTSPPPVSKSLEFYFPTANKHTHTQPTADEPRFLFFSAHDTTVGPLLRALDVYDGVWPPFASYVFLELLEKQPPASAAASPFARLRGGAAPAGAAGTPEYFVRMVYNGRVLKIAPCNGREVCPASVWIGFMQQRIEEGDALAQEIC